MATKLCGRTAADEILAKLSQQVQKSGKTPKLCIIQVGKNPASSSYIRQKEKAAKKSSVEFQHILLDSSATLAEIKAKIQQLNDDESVTGFMLQLPLDSSNDLSAEDVQKLLNSIDPRKDSDGLHVLNQGHLFTGESTERKWTSPLPATALGVMRLLDYYKIPVKGVDVAVIGRSRLVGFPIAALLSHAGATVTILHRRSRDIAKHCRHCKIIIVATGCKHLVNKDFVNKETIVIDVGIHLNEDRSLTGDADPSIYPEIKAYTPVPGGVGPMTVVGLIENTVRLANNTSD